MGNYPSTSTVSTKQTRLIADQASDQWIAIALLDEAILSIPASDNFVEALMGKLNKSISNRPYSELEDVTYADISDENPVLMLIAKHYNTFVTAVEKANPLQARPQHPPQNSIMYIILSSVWMVALIQDRADLFAQNQVAAQETTDNLTASSSAPTEPVAVKTKLENVTIGLPRLTADLALHKVFFDPTLLTATFGDLVETGLCSYMNESLYKNITTSLQVKRRIILQVIEKHYPIFKNAAEKYAQTPDDYPKNTFMGMILRNATLNDLIVNHAELFTPVTTAETIPNMAATAAQDTTEVKISHTMKKSTFDDTDIQTAEAETAAHSATEVPVIAGNSLLSSSTTAQPKPLAEMDSDSAQQRKSEQDNSLDEDNESTSFISLESLTTNQAVAIQAQQLTWLKISLSPILVQISKRILEISEHVSRSERKTKLQGLYDFLRDNSDLDKYANVTEDAQDKVPSMMIGDWLDSVTSSTQSNLEVLSENRRMIKRDIPKTLAFVLSNMTPEMKAFYECKAKMLSKIDEAANNASTLDKRQIWKEAASTMSPIKFDGSAATSIDALKHTFNVATSAHVNALGAHTRKGINLSATFSVKQMSKVKQIADITVKKIKLANQR